MVPIPTGSNKSGRMRRDHTWGEEGRGQGEAAAARRVLRGDETNSPAEERRPAGCVFVSIKRRSHRTSATGVWWTGRCPGGPSLMSTAPSLARTLICASTHTHTDADNSRHRRLNKTPNTICGQFPSRKRPGGRAELCAGRRGHGRTRRADRPTAQSA